MPWDDIQMSVTGISMPRIKGGGVDGSGEWGYGRLCRSSSLYGHNRGLPPCSMGFTGIIGKYRDNPRWEIRVCATWGATTPIGIFVAVSLGDEGSLESFLVSA